EQYLDNLNKLLSGQEQKVTQLKSAKAEWKKYRASESLIYPLFYGPVGSFKNDGFRPILFPDPKDPCVKHKPYKVNLPHFMTWI
ncbi:hypothetical protein MJI95_39555, partial [Salmonella enterica subsp. enterica serovar Kentucky]|nr:hypothetical protein [Salmonella enterica subsp. enterica serovar Kentucky]